MMAWNVEALRLMGLSAEAEGAGLVADVEARLGHVLPTAVAEWHRCGAVRRQSELSDNFVCDGLWDEEPAAARWAAYGTA